MKRWVTREEQRGWGWGKGSKASLPRPWNCGEESPVQMPQEPLRVGQGRQARVRALPRTCTSMPGTKLGARHPALVSFILKPWRVERIHWKNEGAEVGKQSGSSHAVRKLSRNRFLWSRWILGGAGMARILRTTRNSLKNVFFADLKPQSGSCYFLA